MKNVGLFKKVNGQDLISIGHFAEVLRFRVLVDFFVNLYCLISESKELTIPNVKITVEYFNVNDNVTSIIVVQFMIQITSNEMWRPP